MPHPTGESESDALRLDFDRRLKLEFHGSNVTSDAGLLPFRELDDALGLSEMAGAVLSDGRRGKNTRHVLSGLLRQSVFGRLAGYDDVNDADRLARDPAVRWIVGGRAAHDCATSASQMGRFETEWLTRLVVRTSSRSPTSPGIGSTAFIPANRRGQSCSTWIRVSAQPTVIRKAPPTTATSLAPAIIRCSCSISSLPR